MESPDAHVGQEVPDGGPGLGDQASSKLHQHLVELWTNLTGSSKTLFIGKVLGEHQPKQGLDHSMQQNVQLKWHVLAGS